MLAAIIDNGNTWLFDIRDCTDIKANELFNDLEKRYMSNRYIGWLVNSDSMPDIIFNMPISRFMLNNPVSKELEDISKEEAELILEGLVQLRKNSKAKVKKL